MSTRGLLFLLVLGLCATQMVSAHREARGVANMMEAAKSKLRSMMGKVEDAARSSVETVWKYMNQLEAQVLSSGTERLREAGINIDLTAVANLFKSNIKTCISDESTKKEAKAILDNVAGCVTNDINSLRDLIGDMQGLWETAQDLPEVMQDVAKQCGLHGDTDVTEDALHNDEEQLQLPGIDDDDDDLAEESRELVLRAQGRLSKRALWNLGRITTCIKGVYRLTKTDLVTIPGDILSTAANAFRVVRAAQGGIQTCVARKVAKNGPAFAKLAATVSTCVAKGVSEGEDFDAVVASSPSLAALKHLSGIADVADKVKNLG